MIEHKTPQLLAELPKGAEKGESIMHSSPATTTLAAEHDTQVANLEKLDQDLSPP